MKSALSISFAAWAIAQGICLIPELISMALFPFVFLIVAIGGLPSLFGFAIFDMFLEKFRNMPRALTIFLLVVGHGGITYMNGLIVAKGLAEGSTGDYEALSLIALIPVGASMISTLIIRKAYFDDEFKVREIAPKFFHITKPEA